MKLILMFQFTFPMFALLLGQSTQSISRKNKIYGLPFLLACTLTVTLQLLAFMQNHGSSLSQDAYWFSIYQWHLYAASIITSTYILSLFLLWERKFPRLILLCFSPVISAYSFLSTSPIAIWILLVGAVVFISCLWKKARRSTLLLLSVLLLCGSMVPLFSSNTSGMKELEAKISLYSGQLLGTIDKAHLSKNNRLHHWHFYLQGWMADKSTFFIGHMQPPDRNNYASAHNYYLDLAYNFGVVSLLPFIYLIILMCADVRRAFRQKRIDTFGVGLLLVVLCLLFIDNMFKVTFREPYPGILAYFLWGICIAKFAQKNARMTDTQ